MFKLAQIQSQLSNIKFQVILILDGCRLKKAPAYGSNLLIPQNLEPSFSLICYCGQQVFVCMCYGGQHCSLQLPAVPRRKINWQGNFVYRSTMELWIMNLRWPYNYSLLILMMMNMQIISFKFSQQLFNINFCSKYDVFSMMLLSVVQFKLWICCCSIFAWPTFKVKWGNRPFEQVLSGDKQ